MENDSTIGPTVYTWTHERPQYSSWVEKMDDPRIEEPKNRRKSSEHVDSIETN
jgi:hypothetical protein